uniref:Uncharacterized protein n=1 Tax=Klebsiella pneumoniae TaxID=573 RepID=Q1G0V5_KLEPN|nr:unknown [Klebsiella pneumoniae]
MDFRTGPAARCRSSPAGFWFADRHPAPSCAFPARRRTVYSRRTPHAPGRHDSSWSTRDRL